MSYHYDVPTIFICNSCPTIMMYVQYLYVIHVLPYDFVINVSFPCHRTLRPTGADSSINNVKILIRLHTMQGSTYRYGDKYHNIHPVDMDRMVRTVQLL